jgi:hypothetical protein
MSAKTKHMKSDKRINQNLSDKIPQIMVFLVNTRNI